ncbi:MAG: HIRAN domain-containing protein [Erysipelotrichales bacterium]|nr:HIRAN domain-containing protein [Erysipelotrichales bacterium]
MKYELTKADEQKVALLNKQELSEVLKPLKQEIHLFDTYISGTMNIPNPGVLSGLQTGEKLNLKREESLYDDYRIIITKEDNTKLGSIPEQDNVVFARLLDAGKLLIGRVKEKKKAGYMEVIAIGIYMVDF